MEQEELHIQTFSPSQQEHSELSRLTPIDPVKTDTITNMDRNIRILQDQSNSLSGNYGNIYC